ncbi:uncharacterized protein VP01_908g4 [Puccinia sorghi]|uniref:Copia protein n=1 Tax=Puccinia sorghi TaxID=27349 RepID=A0A0L6U7M3_9BASI|nr:uncharacterized protein VP01_908g4 [Puccinia sorghi]
MTFNASKPYSRHQVDQTRGRQNSFEPRDIYTFNPSNLWPQRLQTSFHSHESKYQTDKVFRRTQTHGILLRGSDNLSEVDIYTDADFANCTDDRRSYSGYITTLAGSLLSWRAKKQQTVSTSTTEAEYRALFEGVQESVWLKYLFQSLNINLSKRFEIYVDNQSAIALATNPIFQQRSKHIDIVYHWLREIHDTGLIHIKYIPTNLMLADICTKSLGKSKHQNIISNLQIGRQ